MLYIGGVESIAEHRYRGWLVKGNAITDSRFTVDEALLNSSQETIQNTMTRDRYECLALVGVGRNKD